MKILMRERDRTMKPIYKPKGKAKEYGDYAINIYTGCPHRCFYCFAPNVLHRDRETFHSVVEPRPNIVEETIKQLEREQIKDKLIHLCFTCDPYPDGYDTTATREIIKAIKQSGNHVQILTKGDGSRDFDLLDGNDWYGITVDGASDERQRRLSLCKAHKQGIKTWVSFEPIINAKNVMGEIFFFEGIADKMKFGKLNYHKSDIDWGKLGKDIEYLCQMLGIDYYIKGSLRAEMERDTDA